MTGGWPGEGLLRGLSLFRKDCRGGVGVLGSACPMVVCGAADPEEGGRPRRTCWNCVWPESLACRVLEG